jgi:predicted phosphoribosyltransferase
MFEDRRDAGQQLGTALLRYRGQHPLVLAIPRGGVEVGYHAAEQLGAALSIVVVRKLPLPQNPEAGFGAVAEDGSTYFAERAYDQISPAAREQILREQKEELKRRVAVIRGGKPLAEMSGKTVILVDEGVAMGSTMRGAIVLCRNKEAGKVVVGVPVAGPVTATDLAELADDVVILEEPPFFRAVAEVYRNWYDVGDEEVIRIMKNASNLRGNQ